MKNEPLVFGLRDHRQLAKGFLFEWNQHSPRNLPILREKSFQTSEYCVFPTGYGLNCVPSPNIHTSKP
jgi:hypothetical protein